MTSGTKRRISSLAAPPDTGVLIGYARVSTDDQKLDLQRDVLAQLGCHRVFEDRASGARANRPGLTAALSHLRRDDTLVVWRLDRLGRTTHQLVNLLEQFEREGVRLRSLQDGIDPSFIMGKALLQIAAVFAEMERNLLRERTRPGHCRRGGLTMPIRPALRPLYPPHWRKLSARVRFERARGRCQECGQPHLLELRCLRDGRWFDEAAAT